MTKCKCGCGGEIMIKKYHRYSRVPQYLNGHYTRSEEYKKLCKKLHADPNSKFNSKEYREAIGKGGKNKIITPEYREKCRLQKLGEKNPNFGKVPKHLKGIHKNWKERDPEGYKHHQSIAGKKGFRSCPKISKMELKFQDIFKEMNIDFIPQCKHGNIRIDFLIKPNIALFLDGDFWHGNPIRFKSLSKQQVLQKAKDDRQNQVLNLNGFRVIRLWEHDINDLGKTQIKQLILKLLFKTSEVENDE
jgi:G:T-mismatch repair DNA endonuclease (very short patch repair protein)